MNKIIIFLVAVILIFVSIFFLVDMDFSSENNTASLSFVSPNEQRQVNIIFVGDIMLGRFIETLMKRNGDQYPFLRTSDVLADADLVVANLEGPIPLIHKPTPSGQMTFSFTTTTAKILADNNIKVVSLANNHGLDQGRVNLTNTFKVLNSAGVLPFGDPVLISTTSVTTLVAGEHKISFVGFNATYPQFSLEKAKSLIAGLKDVGQVVVSIHWGEEYVLTHNKQQEDIAHSLIDSGADLIIGHHPHVVQDIEFYKDVPIFYSLGNFIFDQYFSDEVQEGLLVKMTVRGKNVNFEPYIVKSVKSQPYIDIN